MDFLIDGGAAVGLLRSDLLNPLPGKNSELVRHRDPIAPAYLKTVSDILNGGEISVERFGLKGDNSTSNGVRFNQMIADLKSFGALDGSPGDPKGIQLTAPGGVYVFEQTGLVPFDANFAGSNIVLRGSRGTIFRRASGSGSGAVIWISGDLTGTVNARRAGYLTLEDLILDANNVANNYALFLSKATRVIGRNLRLNNGVHGLYAVASSECEFEDLDAYSNSGDNVRLDGARNVPIFGVNTSVGSDRGFVENVRIRDLKSFFHGVGASCLYANHCQSVSVESSYFQNSGPGGAASPTGNHVRIRSENGVAGDAPTTHFKLQNGYLELDAGLGNVMIDVRALDAFPINTLTVRDVGLRTQTHQNQWMVGLNHQGAATGRIVDTIIEASDIYYTATSELPGLVTGYKNVYGTQVDKNYSMGSISGSTWAAQTRFADFNQIVSAPNAQINATAEGSNFNGGGWSSTLNGSLPLNTVSRSSNANAYLGGPTLQLGDSVTAGTVRSDFSLDVSQYRDKCVLITFLCRSNAVGAVLGLNPNSAAPDLVGGDTFFSRLGIRSGLTAAEVAANDWVRLAYVVPINVAAPGGPGGFGSSAASTLLIRLQKADAAAATRTWFADFRVMVSDRTYNRALYN